MGHAHGHRADKWESEPRDLLSAGNLAHSWSRHHIPLCLNSPATGGLTIITE